MALAFEQDTAPAPAPDAIEATLSYIVDDGTKVFTETGGPGATDRRYGGTPDPRQVRIRNGRMAGDFVLEREGFRFIRHDTRVADFFNEDEVKRVYYPEMEALVKAEIGAQRVLVFDHTLRTADDADRMTRKIREVVQRVHTTTPNGRARSACAISCRRRLTGCYAAASPSSRCGGRSAIRSRPIRSRSATPAAFRRRIS